MTRGSEGGALSDARVKPAHDKILYLAYIPAMEIAAELEIVAAGASEKPIVARLVQFYLHDFSEFASIGSPYGDTDARGAFVMENFDTYWREPGRRALLFRVAGQLAGFALVNQWSPSGAGADHSIAEFFVMRKYRRGGIGRRAAHEILRRFPGIWEINVAHYNAPAQEFWRRALADVPGYVAQMLQGDGARWDGPIHRLVPSQRLGSGPAARVVADCGKLFGVAEMSGDAAHDVRSNRCIRTANLVRSGEFSSTPDAFIARCECSCPPAHPSVPSLDRYC